MTVAMFEHNLALHGRLLVKRPGVLCTIKTARADLCLNGNCRKARNQKATYTTRHDIILQMLLAESF